VRILSYGAISYHNMIQTLHSWHEELILHYNGPYSKAQINLCYVKNRFFLVFKTNILVT
jgi:hypothetical protein